VMALSVAAFVFMTNQAGCEDASDAQIASKVVVGDKDALKAWSREASKLITVLNSTMTIHNYLRIF
jgi:hypothetical protein